jgi:hypothetical protein
MGCQYSRLGPVGKIESYVFSRYSLLNSAIIQCHGDSFPYLAASLRRYEAASRLFKMELGGQSSATIQHPTGGVLGNKTALVRAASGRLISIPGSPALGRAGALWSRPARGAPVRLRRRGREPAWRASRPRPAGDTRASPLAWGPTTADLLLHRPLPSQCNHRCGPLAGPHRSAGPGRRSRVHRAPMIGARPAAELDRTTVCGEPDRRAVARSRLPSPQSGLDSIRVASGNRRKPP